VLVLATGGWKSAFVIASLLNVIAAFIAVFVVKPMRQKMMSETQLRPAVIQPAA
jgi:MFS transporter, OFA family, oxalate/formate antiporter